MQISDLNSPVISFQNVSKHYRKKTGVQNITFHINKGEVIGFLGPNGSGKTTTISLLLNVLFPSSGSIHIPGKINIGISPEEISFFPYFSGYKNLKISCLEKRIPFDQINLTLEMTGLSKVKHDLVSTYSHGMKQRLSIANALLGNPDLIIFDEPTNGVDPEGIVEIRNLILSLKERGKTIIISSHLLSEIEKICTRVLFFKKAQIVGDELINTFQNNYTLEQKYLEIIKAN